MVEIRHYLTESGKNTFEQWLDSLRDAKTEAAIAARIARLAGGNFGDCKPLRDGVCELRIDLGPGYRVYYAVIDRTHVLLLCGGEKRRQSANITRAVAFWKDFQKREAEAKQ